MDCFRCFTCSKPLKPGDEFALREDRIYCREDADAFLCNSSRSASPDAIENNNNKILGDIRNKRNSMGGRRDKGDQNKSTRVRTVMNEKQLEILRTCYNANPRPDALMKEQLQEMTGKLI